MLFRSVLLLALAAVSAVAGSHHRHNSRSHHLKHYNPRAPKIAPRAGPSPSAMAAKRSIIYLDLPLGSTDDLKRCPAGTMSCPTLEAPVLAGASSDAPWECVNYLEDLYSCGGCTTLGTGVDCTALPGVRSVSCAAAQCVVHQCQAGFVQVGNECVSAATGRRV